MGLIWWKGRCGACKEPGALHLFGFIATKCPNRSCGHFNAELHYERLEAGSSESGKRPSGTRQNPRTGQVIPNKNFTGDFDPGGNAVRIDYTNFRGERKTFQGDKSSIKKKGAHLTIRLAPTGVRCAFKMANIHNRTELGV